MMCVNSVNFAFNLVDIIFNIGLNMDDVEFKIVLYS